MSENPELLARLAAAERRHAELRDAVADLSRVVHQWLQGPANPDGTTGADTGTSGDRR